MNVLGLIPSRYASTRFPGKPLIRIGDRTMIRHVYEKASEALDEVWVATDDQRIYDEIRNFDGNVVMTSTEHQSGTDRCREALDAIESQPGTCFELVVNIQGDEPFFHPDMIRQLTDSFSDRRTQISTLIKQIRDPLEIFDPNKPKVVKDIEDFALYFSRSPIPFLRGVLEKDWSAQHRFYRHVGIYAYRSEVLREITRLDKGQLELAESLEQLRWLEAGYRIKVTETYHDSPGIDTPEDLRRLLAGGIDQGLL